MAVARSLIVALCLVGAATAAQVSYKGFKVLETDTLTWKSAGVLRDLESTSLDFSFWRSANVGSKARIMASPENLSKLESFLQAADISFSVMVDDVSKAIARSQVTDKMAREKPSSRYNMDWDEYHSHDDLNEFIDEYAATYEFAETVSIGTSPEGRDMRMLQLTNRNNDPNAKNVFIEAGIHAREWIAPAVGTYIIRKLVEFADDHPQYLDQLNFHFIPSANPDGYEYSRDANGDRLWRKSREVNPGHTCLGTDLNRNWDFHWHESGVSDLYCSDVFCGEEAFSATEAKLLSDYFYTIDPVPELSLCLHSAADLLLYPYGYAYNQYPPNKDEIEDVCIRAVDALNAVNNDNADFECINSAQLYPAAGASDDWYASEGSRFTYTPELRDNGFSFLLPPAQIIPSAEEFWAAFVVMMDEILAN